MDELAGRYQGRTFGNYRLLKLIGEGGFSEVYLGEHLHLGTEAAVKVLRTRLTDKEFERFRQEAQTIIGLGHPNMVRVLDFGVQDHIPFIVMSYAPHGSLRDRYPDGTRLPLQAVVSLVKQVAAALQYAHDHQVIHRDIKPDNLLIGSDEEILLSDFGIAVVVHNTYSQKTQEAIGTVAYMAPEQLRRKARLASDQYALGVMAYEWLCGEVPFQGDPIEVALQHLSEPPLSLCAKVPDIPPAVERVVLRALAKDPQERFSCVQAFAEALEKAVSTEQPMAPWASKASDWETEKEVEVPASRPVLLTARREGRREWDESGVAVDFRPRRKDPLSRRKVLLLVSLAFLVVLSASSMGLFFLRPFTSTSCSSVRGKICSAVTPNDRTTFFTSTSCSSVRGQSASSMGLFFLRSSVVPVRPSLTPTPTTSIIVRQGAVYYRIHPQVADASGKVTTEKTNAPAQIRDIHVNACGDQLKVSLPESGSQPSCSTQGPEITLVRKNGTTTVILDACSPEFAPDGKYFAYIGEAANAEGFVRIRKTNSPASDIGNHHMAADADMGNTEFVWSSDGQQIAILASGDNGKIFIYDAFSQDPGKEIDFHPIGNEYHPISLVDWVASQS